MKYTYLLINFLTALFPLLLSFDKRVQFYKSWRYLWQGIVIVGLVFMFWDVVFVKQGVWRFNQNYVTGVTVFELPIEEMLFFVTVPFACLFINACINYYVKSHINAKTTYFVSNCLIISAMLVVAFNYHQLYSLVIFSLLPVLILWFQYVIKAHWLSGFYFTYLVALFPFYLVDSILTALPVVIYNNHETLNRRIGTIPVEDHFYLMALLLMNIGLFEYFKERKLTSR